MLRFLALYLLFISCNSAKHFDKVEYQEQHRPQVHFSPKIKWTNDPNGMVYVNGTYHLFFQYFPDSTVWGPMHWGHTISKDLFHWEEQPIALYPDSLGYIFSGSAVIDSGNTSGFGQNGKPPVVLIYTQHDQVKNDAGSNKYQTQSIAYSVDDGKNFIKYPGNPVLPNPGISNFRDPKVFWHKASSKWIMTLAVKDHITFYTSTDLKSWSKLSEFGVHHGAHGGVWECPDLFSLSYEGKEIWVLIVSIYPGAPNGGSGTQYFTGEFDGISFKPSDTLTKWLDYGKDNYAGITWSNTGSRKIFLGWMSNWTYANIVPTTAWRGAMTLPRDLGIQQKEGTYMLTSKFVSEMENIEDKAYHYDDVRGPSFELTKQSGKFSGPVRLDMMADSVGSFSIEFFNSNKEKLIAGYDQGKNQFYIDRSSSGKTDFYKEFANVQWAPRFSTEKSMNISLVLDHSSVEIIADNGLTVMTNIFFPTTPFSDANIHFSSPMLIRRLDVRTLRSIWKK